MTAFTRELPDNRLLREFGGGLLPATTGQAVGSAITDPRLRPTQELGTQLELEQEAGETTLRDILSLSNVFVGPLVPFLFPKKDESELSPVTSPEELNEEFGYLGLKFEGPTRRRVAEILAKQKREDLIRQDVLSRSPGGFVGTGAVLTASLAGAIIDPLNVAVSFIPIVGEARAAIWAARVGRNTARLSRGAVEGVVGNALIEPAVFTLSRAQQLDYDMTDALLNIGLGGFIGGGLHVAGGKFGDFLSRQTPEVREAALRGSVAQVAQGRTVDIEPVVRPEVRQSVTPEAINRRVEVEERAREILSDEPGRMESIRVASALAGDREALVAEINALRAPEKREGGLIAFLQKTGGLREQGGELANMGITPKTRPGLIRKKGQRLDDAARAAWEAGLFPDLGERPTVNQFLDRLDEEFNRKKTGRSAEQAELDRALSDLGLSTDSPEFIADVVRRLSSEPPFGEPDLTPVSRVDAAEMIRRETSPERESAADFPASERAEIDAERPTGDDVSARQEADELAEEMAALKASGDLDDDLANQLDGIGEFEVTSEGWVRAVKQAGSCLK